MIETSYGLAVVKDYVVKKDKNYPTKLIVELARGKLRDSKGYPRLKEIKLSEAETKEIMIRELIRRQKYIWLVRMYPEERKNLDDLKVLYEGPGAGSDPGGDPTPGTPDTDSK